MSDSKQNQEEEDIFVRQNCCGCLCRPYKDGYVVAAQMLSIGAVFLVSSDFFPTVAYSLAPLVLIQFLWCHRQSRCGMILTIVLSFLAGLLALATAIFELMHLAPVRVTPLYCQLLGNRRNSSDYCTEHMYGILCLVAAGCWMAAAVSVWVFLKNGRYARCEDELHAHEEHVPRALVPVVVSASALEAAGLPRDKWVKMSDLL